MKVLVIGGAAFGRTTALERALEQLDGTETALIVVSEEPGEREQLPEIVKELIEAAMMPQLEECTLEELYPRQKFPKPKSEPLPKALDFIFSSHKTGGRARVWR